MERDDDAARTSSTQTVSAKTEPAAVTETKTTEATASVTAARAKEIALAHAGVSAADARELECETDTDDRVDHYDVEFKANGLEYDYEISFDGTVLKSEKEKDDDVKASTQPSENKNTATEEAPSAAITAARAKEIALAHAGVSAADARGLECEKDTDDRVDHYDVEFKANGLEYDYEISFDGTVLKSEKERDD